MASPYEMYVLLKCLLLIGVMSPLPVEGILIILGNDLAGSQVMTDSCVCYIPCLSTEAGNSKLQISVAFPSCAVTRAMAKKKVDSP